MTAPEQSAEVAAFTAAERAALKHASAAMGGGPALSTSEGAESHQSVTNTRTVIVGFTKDGERCILEWAMPPSDPEERRRYWEAGARTYAAPYGHDIHVALEHVTTSYERITPPGQQDPR